jgi:hypothetical protein
MLRLSSGEARERGFGPKQSQSLAEVVVIVTPLWILGMLAGYCFGFAPVVAAGTAILIGTLVDQRVMKKRTWHSILWGIYASRK